MSHATLEEQLQQRPPQSQSQKPGSQAKMTPKPLIDNPEYRAAGKLKDKVALITGGDSGIGASVAVLYAREGADVAIVYLNEEEDARETKQIIEKYGQKCLLISGDVGSEAFCRQAVEKVVQQFGKLDILVNNAAIQWEAESIVDMDMAKMERTFRTNVFAMFYLCQAAMPFLKPGSSIINTSSVNSHKGSTHMVDYTSTKGAIDALTISLAQQLADKKIRVNAVAPGPIWTPLIVDTFDEQAVAEFGTNVLMKRAGQPSEVSPCYVFLASQDASYMTGQIMHPNGGTIVN
jgi:NAD(P)-dependent dehydrogenase (short-subunit alcohol dehydrogenase family)